MDHINFAGKEYTKAALIAKRFGYTADYIGQLCRSGRVAARLVGRSWYVDIDSIHEHRGTKYKKEETNKQTVPKVTPAKYLSRVDVEPILNKNVIKLLRNTSGGTKELSVRYQADEYALIPKVEKDAVSKILPILPAGAARIRVMEGFASQSHFKAEDLPEVSLKGQLTVEEYPETATTSEPKADEVPNNNLSEQKAINLVKQRHLGNDSAKVRVKIRPSGTTKIHTHSLHTTANGISNRTPIPSSQSVTAMDSVQPSIKSEEIASRSKPRLIKPLDVKSTTLAPKSEVSTIAVPRMQGPRFTLTVGFLGTMILALCLSTLLLITEVEITVTEENFISRLSLQTASLSQFFAR
jgi:hypothetical protein